MNYVGGEGPSTAKLVAVGEAPGADEEAKGRPFVGPSGQMVDNLLKTGGYSRAATYVTNVCKIRPPQNKIKDLPLLGKTLDDFIPQLHEEIRQINPNCILALGNTALEALTGFRGIEKFRGSILQSNFGPYKVVATLHPASILHGEMDGKMKSWKDLTYIQWDVTRAISQSKFPDIRTPKRHLMVCNNSLQLHRFLRQYEDCDLVSVDIETYRTVPICIAFAFNRDEAMSVPLTNYPTESGMSYEELAECWHQICEVMVNERIRKIGQNFKFDEKQLATCIDGTCNFGIVTRGFYFDTLLAFRVLYPELSGSLQFSTSVMTEEPYYKDEGREYNPLKDRLDRLLLYNARDAAVTFEVYERCLEELKERHLDKFFFGFQMPLHSFYSRIEDRGILRDNNAKEILKEKYTEQWNILQGELNSLTAEYVDRPMNVNSNGKNGDMPFLVYGCMKLPIRKGTDEATLDALRRNGVVKDPKKLRILDLIQQIRKVRKTIGTYIDAETDHRGRLLTQFRIILETGRTSTGVLKPPVATRQLGLAFQTITKHGDIGSDLRRMFIPDPGYVFIEPDLSGAEARVVALLANDSRLLKAFRFEIDIHRLTASWIFDVALSGLLEEFWTTDDDRSAALAAEINKLMKAAISNDQRQIGKVFRHAGHYDIQKKTAAETAGISEYKANQILEKFHKTNPNIKGVFHKEIISTLKWNNRTLVSPNGRQRLFLNKWGEELWREAYAQIPQSTVSDQNKKAAQAFELRCPESMILAESHDSFLVQTPLALNEQYPMRHIDKAIQVMKEEMESPIDFKNCSLSRGELIIPCEIKFSESNWEDMKPI
jgi:DNA polymerase